MHGVRPNGSAYEPHHIVAGDGPLQPAGNGSAAKVPIPFYTREQIAVAAGTEAGGLAGSTAGATAGKEAGYAAGVEAGEEAGQAVAANSSIPRHEVEAAAYKAGFEAGKAEGAAVTALVKIDNSTIPKASNASSPPPKARKSKGGVAVFGRRLFAKASRRPRKPKPRHVSRARRKS